MTKQNLTVGQDVAVETPGTYNNSYAFGFTVKKVTPSGQVVVARKDGDYELRFDADGYAMGGMYSKWRRPRLVVDVEAARKHVADREAAMKAATLINAVRVDDVRSTYGKGRMQQAICELEEKLAAARTAVEAL